VPESCPHGFLHLHVTRILGELRIWQDFSELQTKILSGFSSSRLLSWCNMSFEFQFQSFAILSPARQCRCLCHCNELTGNPLRAVTTMRPKRSMTPVRWALTQFRSLMWARSLFLIPSVTTAARSAYWVSQYPTIHEGRKLHENFTCSPKRALDQSSTLPISNIRIPALLAIFTAGKARHFHHFFR
jgi:hypothetical protein